MPSEMAPDGPCFEDTEDSTHDLQPRRTALGNGKWEPLRWEDKSSRVCARVLAEMGRFRLRSGHARSGLVNRVWPVPLQVLHAGDPHRQPGSLSVSKLGRSSPFWLARAYLQTTRVVCDRLPR